MGTKKALAVVTVSQEAAFEQASNIVKFGVTVRVTNLFELQGHTGGSPKNIAKPRKTGRELLLFRTVAHIPAVMNCETKFINAKDLELTCLS